MGLHPARLADWQETAGGVTVHVPRRQPMRLFARLFKKASHIRLNLDELGGFVWLRCDGSRTVSEIATELEREFGDRADSATHRVSVYVKRLAKWRLITYQEVS
jgi:hypothetical protein